MKFLPTVIAFIIVLLIQIIKRDIIIPLLVIISFALSYILTWITLSEPFLDHYLVLSKLVGINLMIYEVV